MAKTTATGNRDAAGPRRHFALAVRRNVRSDLLTQGFVYDDRRKRAEARFKGEEPGFIYSRYANPTVDMFERRMCALEGAEDARAMSSGMAAVAAALLCAGQGRRPCRRCASALFGSCRYIIETLMPKYGIQSTLVDGSDIKDWQDAVRPNTKSCSSWKVRPIRRSKWWTSRAVANIANAIGARLVVDNVFATPLQQKPLELGAHIVVYSATKHIDGQGRCLGGIVLSDKKWIDENLHDYFRHTGPSAFAVQCLDLLKGLETLPIRVKQHDRKCRPYRGFPR
jgi:O-succinylhomoserine sulfhydrylase